MKISLSFSWAATLQMLLLLALTSVLSFKSPLITFTRSTNLMMSSKPPTYAELLQASKESKQNKGGPRQPVIAPIAPVARSSPVATTANDRQAPDGLPFDDAIYDHLKLVIGKLSARIKSDTPLTPDELESFKISCTEIIRDAKSVLAKPAGKSSQVDRTVTPVTPATPEPAFEFQNVSARRDGKDRVHKPPAQKQVSQRESDFVIHEMGEGPRSEEAPDPNSEFSDLHGLSNTWQMPGMDNMTTDEYYAAINARIVSMKNKRKQTPGNSNTMVNDYFESLSKPRPST